MSGYAANTIQTGILQQIFNAKAVGSGSSGLASSSTGLSTGLWISLHIADPVASGSQNTNETTYASYARIITDRTTAVTGWAVTGNSPASCSPLQSVTFAQCSATTTALITNFGVGSSSAGAGTLWFSGPVTSNINVNSGVTPSLTTATAVTLD